MAKTRRGGAYHRRLHRREKRLPIWTRILIATGSEAAARRRSLPKELGAGTRVVSMPCQERFDRQSQTTTATRFVPSKGLHQAHRHRGRRLSHTWWTITSAARAKVIGIDRFGISAPGDTVMEQLSMTPAAIVAAAKA